MNAPAVELPALDGRDPLGFLAALGLLRVLTSECDLSVQLAFSDTTACAQLHGPFETAEEIAASVTAVAENIPADGVLPGIDPSVPPPSASGKDPLRQERPHFRHMVDKTRAADLRAADLWLPALVTDLAADGQGRCAITPMTAPVGQQKLRTFFEKPLQRVRSNPACLHQALTRWQRVEGFTGAIPKSRAYSASCSGVIFAIGHACEPSVHWISERVKAVSSIRRSHRRVNDQPESPRTRSPVPRFGCPKAA